MHDKPFLEKVSRSKFFTVCIYITEDITFFSKEPEAYFCWKMKQENPVNPHKTILFIDICEVKDPEGNFHDSDTAIREAVLTFWEQELLNLRRCSCTEGIAEESDLLYFSLFYNNGLPEGLMVEICECVSTPL